MKNLSIVFPCYNEEKNLKLLFNKIKKINKKNKKIQIEFIIVNNGSTDKTSAIIQKYKNKIKNLKVVQIFRNVGYGDGILNGLKKSNGQIIAWTHADMQTKPEDIIKIYNKYKDQLINNTCIVKGLRKNRPLFDSLFTFLMETICRIFLKKNFKDINAQPKVFNRNFLSLLKNSPNDFSLDLFFMYVALINNFKIITFLNSFDSRKRGISKGGGSLVGKIKLSFNTLKYIYKLYKKNGYNNS